MYVNRERYVKYTYVSLVEKLCYKKNGSMNCIISMHHDLKLWDLMHFLCHKHRDTSPL